MTIPGPTDLAARTERALALVRAAYRHEPLESPPLLVGDVNYWITGEDPTRIPVDYFEPGAGASQQASSLEETLYFFRCYATFHNCYRRSTHKHDECKPAILSVCENIEASRTLRGMLMYVQ